MITTWARLALICLVGITFAGLITCSAISFPVALIISTTNIFTLCPSFNLHTFERQQLYSIWPWMGSLIICPWVYNPIYSLSNLSGSKVNLNIDARMNGSFGPQFVSMKTTCSSQCLTSVYETWSHLWDRTKTLQFNTQRITTMHCVFGNALTLLLAFLPSGSPKYVSSCGLHCLSFLVVSRISHAHCFENIWTHCRLIHSALWKITTGSQSSNVTNISATPVSECRGLFETWFRQFCPWIMDRCFFSRNPATNTFFHLLNAL